MSDRLKTQSSNKQRLSFGLIGGIMAIVAVFSPLVLSINSSEWDTSIMIVAMTWQGNISSWGSYFYFDLYGLFASLPFTFLRLAFLVLMIRLYQGKTTKKRTLIVGILSELQLVILFYGAMIISILLSPYPPSYLQIMIPVPLLLLTGILIMHFDPPKEGTMWIEEETAGKSWWEKPDEEPTTTEPPKEKAKKSKEPESPW